MSTPYNVKPTISTSYNVKPKIISFDYITWNESVDTWNSVTETWDGYYSGFIEGTQWNGRPII